MLHLRDRKSQNEQVVDPAASESGQSIVLLAAVFVILLLFVGLAVDVGLGFVRSSMFSRAVDSAALAGVVDLDPTVDDTGLADERASQFLGANGWPTNTLSVFDSLRSVTTAGIPQYTLTVTWPVELYFLRLLGFEGYPITRSASAAFFAQAELYTPTAFDYGKMGKASQFLFGPSSCTQEGDPVTPIESTPGSVNEDYVLWEGVYRYRIVIPDTYTATLIRIELFDPDSVNLRGNSATISHTLAVSDTLGPSSSLDCNGSSLGMGDSCVISTGESLDTINQNPFWFQRVDETWVSDCSQNAGQAAGDTVTNYELYYYNTDGVEVPLASYIVDNAQAASTDMKWVVPGVTANVSTAFGSFDVNISALPAGDDGSKTLQMDVTGTSGSSKNVWDLWAGPPPSYYSAVGLSTLDSDVNLRNLQVSNNPTAYQRAEITALALGRMPLNSYAGDTEIELHLAPLDISTGDGTIYSSIFDYDTGTPPPDINFEIDTVSTAFYDICTTVVDTPTGSSGSCSIPYEPLQATCEGDQDCANNWTFPQYTMGIPGASASFFGGDLVVKYRPRNDAHTWSLAITAGRPFLTR